MDNAGHLPNTRQIMPKVDEELCSPAARMRASEVRREEGTRLLNSKLQPQGLVLPPAIWVFPALTYRFLPAVSRVRGAHWSTAIRRFASR
jgi:hypothetical protein